MDDLQTTIDNATNTVSNVASQAKDAINKVVNPNLAQQWGNTLANTGKAVGDYATKSYNYVADTYKSPGFQQGLQNIKNTAVKYGSDVYDGVTSGNPKYLAGAAAGLVGAAYLRNRMRQNSMG